MLGRILFIFLFILTLLNGKSEKFSGYINAGMNSGDFHSYNGIINKDMAVTKFDTLLNYDYFNDRVKFTISQGLFKGSKIYNKLLTSVIKPTEFYYLNELSVEYMFNNNYSINIGLLPFKNGTFHEYSFTGDVNGNGLMLSSYQIVNGIFLIYKKNNFLNIIGYGEKDKFIKSEYNLIETNKPIMRTTHNDYDYKGSGGLFWISKYDKDKHYLELNLFKIDIKINNYNLANTLLTGIGYSYDDTEYSGNVFYTIFMYSKTKGNSIILNNGIEYIRNGYHFGPIDTKGYQYLIGYNYTYDSILLNRELTFNVEYLKTNNGFLSLNTGEPFISYSYGILGEVRNASIGINYDKNLRFLLRYCVYKNNGSKIATGGISEVTNTINSDFKKTIRTSLEMIYKF